MNQQYNPVCQLALLIVLTFFFYNIMFEENIDSGFIRLILRSFIIEDLVVKMRKTHKFIQIKNLFCQRLKIDPSKYKIFKLNKIIHENQTP